MESITTNTSFVANVEKINDEYEYIQYNEKLRLIHSIKDDMYQMQSIITSCGSKKQPTRWLNLAETNEIIEDLATMQNCTVDELIQQRDDLPNGLRGYYIHKLLVNDIACWANRKYALYIAQLLDSIFEKQRNELQAKVEEQKPRMVPEGKQNNYKYMIWKEDIGKEGFIRLHLVRRSTKSFYELTKIKNSDACWFYISHLPIAMTPNEDIKIIIKRNFSGNEAIVKGCNIDIQIDLLDRLKELVTKYFETYQE